MPHHISSTVVTVWGWSCTGWVEFWQSCSLFISVCRPSCRYILCFCRDSYGHSDNIYNCFFLLLTLPSMSELMQCCYWYCGHWFVCYYTLKVTALTLSRSGSKGRGPQWNFWTAVAQKKFKIKPPLAKILLTNEFACVYMFIIWYKRLHAR